MLGLIVALEALVRALTDRTVSTSALALLASLRGLLGLAGAASSPSSAPAPATAQHLPPFQRRVASDLAEAFETWAGVDQLAAGLALTVRNLSETRSALDGDLESYATDLRDAVFALAMSLCHVSSEVTGLSGRYSPLQHAIRLRELLALEDPDWYTDSRRSQVLGDARKALARPED